jgi:succinyl-CoA synthetase alpha subunit
MAFLVDETTRVLIQGITGRLGRVTLQLMRNSGTEPVAGVTPGRGGTVVEGVPVFDTVDAAVTATGATASIVLVPGLHLRDAGLEALAAGMNPVVLMVDGVPINTSLDLVAAARTARLSLIGPNSPGVFSPGRCLLGALDHRFYQKGTIAVVSRSGGMMTTIAHALSGAGLGQSTCVGIGGDAVIGVDLPAAVALAGSDPDTAAVVVYGEVGTTQENQLARHLTEGFDKPVFAYVAGLNARADVRYSHAGAKVDGDEGSARAKREILRSAGVTVADSYPELVEAVAKVVAR